MKRNPPFVASLLIVLLISAVLVVRARPAPAGDLAAVPLPDGARAWQMELVGSLGLDGVNADIAVRGDYAYIGTAGEECAGTGVKVIDIADPTNPTLVGVLAQYDDTSQEDIAIIPVSTTSFRGDLLAVGLQRCGRAGLAGVDFWDVTSPRRPERLGFSGTPNVDGAHELSLVQRPSDGMVLALLAVQLSEASGAGGDFRIIDATDPRNPVQLSDWVLGRELLDGGGQVPVVFGHSVTADESGTRAYVSYWDAGFVILDISDPTVPFPVGQTSYASDDEGSGHSTALAQGGRILVGADEDFNATVKGMRIDAPTTLAGTIEAVEPVFAPRLRDTGPVSGNLIRVGPSCPDGATPGDVPGGALLADPVGQVALIDGSGDCDFTPRVRNAAEAGAIAAVVASERIGHPFPWPPFIPTEIPAVMIRPEDAEPIRAALAGGTPVAVTLSDEIILEYNDWGYLRFYDLSNPADPVQVGRFGTDHAFTDRIDGPPDEGRYSVHNAIVDGNLVFASWYSDGVRAIDITDPANPRETGYFVPPTSPSRTGGWPDGPLVWGVVRHGDLLLLSDMNYGLWIVRYRPAGP